MTNIENHQPVIFAEASLLLCTALADLKVIQAVHPDIQCDSSIIFLRDCLASLKLTWHLKMDGWNTSFHLGWLIFRGVCC